MRWLECLVDTTRRQMAMRGAPPDEIERAARGLAERALAEGLNGRSAAYHRQLDEIEPAILWSRVLAPILVVRGEHDWVVDAGDQARIAELVPELVEIVDVPGVDHVLGRHADREASLRDYGSAPFDPAVVRPMIEWIDRL
jgi:pimeloyl-ACP methyl ester carboxylesterase